MADEPPHDFEEFKKQRQQQREERKRGGNSGAPHQDDATIPDPKTFTASYWLNRDDLAEPDRLLGDLLSTTSRVMLIGPTGIGKTSFGVAVAFAAAAGKAFLHWCGRRPARLLYIDGEMSARLARERLRRENLRWGAVPETLWIINRDDFPNLPPLNTEDGQKFVEWLIEQIGDIDVVVFDNMQALLVGSLKDDDTWAPMIDWTKRLTARKIGQLWLHHTGHDTSRGYGDKSREWQFDTVGILKEVPNSGWLLAFQLEFTKARERSPENRADFDPASIWLDDDNIWRSSAKLSKPRKPPSPQGRKFFDALTDAVAKSGVRRPESAHRPSVTKREWKAECCRLGLVDTEKTEKQQATVVSKYRLELLALDWIACNGDFVWSRSAPVATDMSPSGGQA
jgi:hypothetical protein